MKASTATAFIAASVATFVQVNACEPADLAKLYQLAIAEDTATCQDDSLFSIVPTSGWPIEDQFTLMCVSDACTKTMAKLKELSVSDCDVALDGPSVNFKSLADNFKQQCDVLLSTPLPSDRCTFLDLQFIVDLRTSPNVELCENDSGYIFSPTSSWPTEDQFQLMCSSQACVDTVNDLKKLNPRDCEYAYNGTSINFKKLGDSFEPTCKSF